MLLTTPHALLSSVHTLITMRTGIYFLMVAAFLVGCSTDSRPNQGAVTPLPRAPSTPPFPTTGRLTDSQLNWYIQKAIAWMQPDREILPDGTSLPRIALIYGNAIDHSRPIECVQSEDGGKITVAIPQRIENNFEHWLEVHFDTHSGNVMSHGSRSLTKNAD